MRLTLNTFLITAMLMICTITSAHAYVVKTTDDCRQTTFKRQPTVVLHYSEMNGFDIVSFFQLVDAMEDIHNSINAVGGTSAGIAGFELSSEPFDFYSAFGDSEPKIHVGWTDVDETDADYCGPAENVYIGAAKTEVDDNCNITEGRIMFQNPSIRDWNFAEPGLSGHDHWEAGEKDLSGTKYFRISYVHEVLHTFGFAHSDNSYSMLNYGERPWLNRSSGHMIAPLPDDVEALRDAYPSSGKRTELGLGNTWYNVDDVSIGTYPAARQAFLCEPSLGTDWAHKFDSTCGETSGASGSVEVCPGDNLRTRIALANYSTEGLDVNMTVTFSTDPELGGGDVSSPTVKSVCINENKSALYGRIYEVPSLTFGQEYYVIMDAVGLGQNSGKSTRDWIPLRGTITVKSWAECHTSVLATH